AGALQRSVDRTGRMSRDAFEGLLDAMRGIGWIGIEDAEYEKDGEVRRYRKISLAEVALGPRIDPQELLIADGIVEEFAPASASSKRKAKPSSARRSAS